MSLAVYLYLKKVEHRIKVLESEQALTHDEKEEFFANISRNEQ